MDLNNELNRVDDLFDSINNLTTSSYHQGFIDGKINGEKAAMFEGFKTGLRISMNINQEIGYYFGTCDHYKALKKQSNGSELRAYNLSIQICELILKIDISDPHNENLVNNLEHIRDKFKQFCSLTNFKSEFSKKTTPSKDSSNISRAIRMNF